MQDAIQPLHRLAFTDLSPDGVHGIAMNPVAPTVYVHVHQQLVDPLAVALAYWPWVLTPIAALLLLFIAWRTLRILSHPQRKGVPHCRKCNYDLEGVLRSSATPPSPLCFDKGEGRGEGSIPPAFSTPPTSESCSSSSSSSSPCPECGRPLTPSTIRQGRSTRRRLAPLAIPALALPAIASLATLFATGWRPILLDWPSPKAQWVFDQFGMSPPKPLCAECSTIVEMDLAQAHKVRTVLRCVPPFQSFALSPSGDAIIAAGIPDHQFMHYDAATGRQRRRLDVPYVPAESGPDGAICGFSDDGSIAYLRVGDSKSGPTVRVLRWSLVDGFAGVELEIPLGESRNGQYTNCSAPPLLIIPGDRDRILALPMPYSYHATGTYAATLYDGDEQPNARLERPPRSRWESAALTHDGNRLYLASQAGVTSVDVTTLSVFGPLAAPPSSELFSAFGSWVSVDHADWFVAVQGCRGHAIEMRDTRAATWLTPLHIPSDLLVSRKMQFSSDGAFAAACAFPSSGGGPTSRRNELLIWNILPLRVSP